MAGPWKATIRGPDLGKVSIVGMIQMRILGELAFDLQEDRVKVKHQDINGKPLPPYSVRAREATGRQKVKRNRGAGWDARKRNVTPDILAHMQEHGGVYKHVSYPVSDGAEAIYYTERCPDKRVRGKQWGWRWESREAFLAATGGKQVDYTVTGQMWRGRKIKERAIAGKPLSVSIGFRGAVGRNVFETDMKKRKQAEEKGRDYKPSPAIKAALCDMRTGGRLSWSQPHPFAGLTDAEMLTVLQALDKQVLAGIAKIPITVVVKQ
jgi:hypothetical protein